MEDLEKFEQFFRQFYDKELRDAARQGKKSIIVDFALLDKFDPIFADKLLNEPGAMLVQARKAIAGIDLPEGLVSIEPRFKNLPEQQNIRIRNLRSQHIGQFVCIDGIIRRAAEVKPEISVATFQCPDCATKIQLEQTDRILKSPVLCECGRKGKFPLVGTELFDARWIMVEEPFEIATGERPGEVSVYLKNDLTTPEMQRRTDPGNRIIVNGIVNEIRKTIKGRMRTQLDIFIEANYIEQTEVEWEEVEIGSEDEAQIKQLAADPDVYKKLVGSIAPSIYGMEEIKQAIILQLFGGVPHTLPDKVRIRGDIHILLLGDPSCLVADERVVLSDGTIMKIGQIGSTHLQKINYNVHLGMGRKSGKAKIFHTYKKQPIIEIVTETGKSLKGTPNQPVLIIKNMQQFWKRLDEVKVGDKVQVLPKIECRKKSLVETNWKDYPYYHKSWHIKVPKFVNEELAGLFGYILADGWVQNRRAAFVINKEEADILPKIKNAFEKCFGTSVSTYKHIRASPKINYYQVDRSHIAKLLSFLNEKRVPDLIFSSGNFVVASFLRWLYEGDGCVFSKGRGSLSVSLKSNNIELLRDVQILLLRFGIHSRILWEDKKRSAKIKGREITASPSGSLMIRRSESIIKFWQNIGFISKKKKLKLKQAVHYARSHIHRIHKSRSEKIVKINKLHSQDVFDIEVPKYHRFVANGIVVHNTAKSQLLKLISQIIPRGKYVAGRGTTAAGLTATVIKDEIMGGWVLEAGAMVLANKGILAIDEFDKMSKEDQIAMHEALEQQTVSIAKASIIATLPAQVSVLAGSNPKLSRFDPYRPIAQQIDIPDTLLSRFDLKFALMDIPEKKKDELLATHILETRLKPSKVKPILAPEFLRKYVAYARKNCAPKPTREALEKLKQFYIDMRGLYIGEDVVPITLRQNEALLRLTEASAKIRLSDKVSMEDAERAISVMKFSLQQLGYDYETRKFDIDRTEGVPSSQRSKILALIDIINKLEKQFGKQIPREEIITSAEDEGIKNVEEVLQRLKHEGMIFEPRQGFVQRV